MVVMRMLRVYNYDIIAVLAKGAREAVCCRREALRFPTFAGPPRALKWGYLHISYVLRYMSSMLGARRMLEQGCAVLTRFFRGWPRRRILKLQNGAETTVIKDGAE